MLKTRKEIERWLDKYKIENYHINDDLTINVMDSVDLGYKGLKELPVQFNIIDGSFIISNNKLKTLKGCPKIVYGDFKCCFNILKSLEFSPTEVSENYFCNDNKLSDLTGAPKIIRKSLFCQRNKLTSLKGTPETIKLNFCCEQNNISSLEYLPKKVGKDLIINNNRLKLSDLKELMKIEIKEVIFCHDNIDLPCNLTTIEEIKRYYEKERLLEETQELVSQKKVKIKI